VTSATEGPTPPVDHDHIGTLRLPPRVVVVVLFITFTELCEANGGS